MVVSVTGPRTVNELGGVTTTATARKSTLDVTVCGSQILKETLL